MKEQYIDINFRKSSLELIYQMNAMLTSYRNEGYVVTVRQLYYQLVAKDIIENSEKSYKKITNLVNDARMAGLMDWDMIEDRTRSFERRNRWNDPKELVRAAAQQYHIDMWDNQDVRVFCVVEKEALAGVLTRPCHRWDVPLLAARGYPSVTVIREFVEEDILPALGNGQQVRILHLGDHDPSGIDMTRDLQERIAMFCRSDAWMVTVDRLALNMDQVDDQQPPPNPAKTTDSRFLDYQEKYGSESWELDALAPSFLDSLVTSHIEDHLDPVKWEEAEKEKAAGKSKIHKAADTMETA